VYINILCIMKKLLFIYSLSLLSCFSSAQTITTIAGNGVRAFSGDGGPSALAEIYMPWGICFDKRGNLFFSDNCNYRLREINTAGIITTIAGNGVNGYTGDGGPATAAELLYPQGLTVDDSGNLYDAEFRYNIVRKTIASSGIIITYAGNGGEGYTGDGGPATLASLNNPNGVRIDSLGNLYIVDCVNNVIREVLASSHIIITIAGNGYEYGSGVGSYSGDGGPATAAELNVPRGLGFDSAGNYYIADWHNNIIRKVTVSTGIITTVAGNYAYGVGYSGDDGPATLAELNDPIDVVADSKGDLFIADELNGVIREVKASSGIITTIAGDEAFAGTYNGDNIPATTAGLNSPDGIAISAPNIFISDQINDRIREVDSVIPVSSSIKSFFDRIGISLFPNPNNGSFIITLSNINEKCSIEIYNELGEIVLVGNLRYTHSDNLIDLTRRPNGIYLYRINSESGALIGEGKVVIEK
jgi:trimeric autotransporter adhesin